MLEVRGCEEAKQEVLRGSEACRAERAESGRGGRWVVHRSAQPALQLCRRLEKVDACLCRCSSVWCVSACVCIPFVGTFLFLCVFMGLCSVVYVSMCT